MVYFFNALQKSSLNQDVGGARSGSERQVQRLGSDTIPRENDSYEVLGYIADAAVPTEKVELVCIAGVFLLHAIEYNVFIYSQN